ncbi:MAG: hypothetical protein COA79_02905 [Planctomycetota bacterium]|nr:MAG: hypothetical protein COA79_02905 [Planctomycetota bacterium]
MKQQNIVLLEKLFEDSITESESEILLNRIQSKEINIEELRQALSINSHINTLLSDEKSKQMMEVITRLSSSSGENFNRSILSKIERRNYKRIKSNFILKLAAAFILLIGGAFIINQYLKNDTGQNFINPNAIKIVGVLKSKSNDKKIYAGDKIVNDVNEIKKLVLLDQSEIEIHPETIINVGNNSFQLKKGSISCRINKRNKKEQLTFMSNNVKAHILGTQFELKSYKQQLLPHSLLLLKEGSISISANNGQLINGKPKYIIQNDQFIFSDRFKNKMSTGTFNSKINNTDQLYKQQKTPWINPFWSLWGTLSKDFKISPTDILEKTEKGNLKISFDSTKGNGFRLRSKLVKRFGKKLHYNFNIPVTFESGSLTYGLRFYTMGIPYKEDSLIVSKENGKISLQIYSMFNGKVNKGKKQFIKMNRLKSYVFQGNIITTDTTESIKNTYKNNKGQLVTSFNDIKLEFFIEDLKDCKGYLEIQKGLVTLSK